MPTPRQGPSPFIEGTTHQYAWDATSLSALMTCPKYYEYVIIDGYRPRGDSVHLFFGGLFAKALEQYHLTKANGISHEEALKEIVAEFLERTWIWDAIYLDENNKVDKVRTYKDGGGKPWNSQHSKKNRETLIRSVIWYLENYREDPTQTIILENGKAAVELSFQFDSGIPAPNGQNYILSGHLDRLVQFGDERFVQDQKTTGSTLGAYFFEQFNPHTQMSLYTLASRVVFNTRVSGVIIDAAQIAVGFTAFARSITMRSEDQLEEWLGNIRHWLELARRFSDSGDYPRNESSCHKYGGCAFRDVCSKSPSVRQQFLDTDFDKSDPWNPLRIR